MPFKHPFDSYYEEIIKPAAKAVGLEAKRADEIYITGPIIQVIWGQIWAATVVIADVTNKNPNVNYELGICHTLGVPTVIITQDLEDVPFDYRHRRCIPYNTADVDWQRKLKKEISGILRAVIEGKDVPLELGWPYETSPYNREQLGALVPALDARDSVVRGSRIVRDAVAYAYGPHGTSVAVNVAQGRHEYYRKGAAIAGSMQSLNPLEANGIAHAKAGADEMRSSVGDGSKTALLLFHKILECGSAALKRNHPLNDLVRGMERSTEVIVSAIRNLSRKATGDAVMKIARTASHGDKSIAAIVVEAYKKAGGDGVVVIEQTGDEETVLDVQEGMHFDRGYIDRAFVGSSGDQECTLENAYILICDFKISSMKDLLPLLGQVATSKSALLVIADDVEGEALATLVVNRQKGNLDCLAVRAPGYADRRRSLLQDIAVLTGATLVSLSLGPPLATVTLQHLGRARKVVVSKDNTTVLGGAGEEQLGPYIEGIRDELANTKDPYAAEKLRERLAKLNGAIAAIRIGGISSQEVADGAYLAESAVHSVQKAIEEGVVIGAGASFIQAKIALKEITFKRPGEVAGLQAIEDAMEEPLRQLVVANSLDPTDILKKINRAKRPNYGFDVRTNRIEDLAAAGVLDPTSTATRAIQVAFSHARTVLSTGAWDSSNRTSPAAQGADAEGARLPTTEDSK